MPLVQAAAAAGIPPPGGRGELSAPAAAGCAFAVANLAARQRRRFLFIARDIPDAEYFLEELAFFAPDLARNFLPEWDVLPYDNFSPAAETVAERITALAGLLDNAPGVTVTTAAAALSPAPPPEFLAARAFHLRTGARLDLPALLERLAVGGYARVERVLEPGEFAVYGGQADVFPPDAEQPFRLVLLDDEIEQIRVFDPKTQRSVGQLKSLRMLPMSECDLSPDGLARFRGEYERRFGRECKTFSGLMPPGGEFFLPLFFEKGGRIFDYLRRDAVVVARQDINDKADEFLQQARRREKMASIYEDRPALPASELFMDAAELQRRLGEFSLLEVKEESAAMPEVAVNRTSDSPRDLISFVKNFGGKIIIVAGGKGKRDSLATLLAAAELPAAVCETFAEAAAAKSPAAVIAPLRGGFLSPEQNLAVLTEAEIFRMPPLPQRRRRRAAERGEAGDIKAGDLVVHPQYGIGRARGLKDLAVGGERGEFFEIEYAGSQTLWLSVAKLHLLDIYHGEAELSKMGSGNWRRTRRRAERRAYDAAARLLDINARRAAAAPRQHAPDEALLARFISNFAYPETPDQDRAAAEVLADLRSEKPMDRLIAADVGFGKTEIALRAAAAVVFGGRQAAVLAPTTLLAEQHSRVFADRFAGFPVRVECLTRLTTPADRRRILSGLAAGEVDVIIGTHTLLQKSAKYKKLGLAVIDEEHRFGVNHKEKFKDILAGVDLLSLSATPIPRTLAMALEGMRDMSVINTPPAERRAAKVLVAPFSRAAVTEACEREIRRGGQVFFVHNEIYSIEEMGRQLAAWMPQASVITAHGGMAAAALEDTMRRFVRREADILLCTTIVESGLDIPNANTIVINRADRMGLSRLHQLRGRVGRRAATQAYAYLLTPENFDPTPAAQTRLETAKNYSSTTGGGFFLSVRDLEMRGAGELLGEKQSGEMESVGYGAYQRMVNAAARQIRGEPQPANADLSVSLPAAVMLPPAYVPSPAERVRYYRKLAAAERDEEIDKLVLEWGDRFGNPPPPARLLADSHRIRLAAAAAGAEDIRVAEDGAAVLRFSPNPPGAEKLLQKTIAGECRTTSGGVVKLSLDTEAPREQALRLLTFLRSLC